MGGRGGEAIDRYVLFRRKSRGEQGGHFQVVYYYFFAEAGVYATTWAVRPGGQVGGVGKGRGVGWEAGALIKMVQPGGVAMTGDFPG